MVTINRGRPNRRVGATLSPASVSALVEPQPGGRAPASGDLALVQSFLNSRWDLEGPDHLRDQIATPAELENWLRRRDLLDPGSTVTAVQLQRALDVRAGLQALAFVNNGATGDLDAIERLNRSLRGPGLFVQLNPSTPPDFHAERKDVDAALALLATIVGLAQLDGRWERLKACPGRHCGWAFYDHSRNQNSNWCAMSVCGSRAKAREYRGRQRQSPGTSNGN
jgi:predicted RNA-binding Zn ribbon-like protein